MTPQNSLAATPTLRTASLDDVDTIVAITNRAFLAESFCVRGERTDAADIRQRFSVGVFFVADDPADPTRLLASVYCSVENSRGYLGLIAIQPDAQGSGYSRILLSAVEQYCRNADCQFLDITVVNVRDDLFQISAKLGFAAFDVVPFPVP
ncbi:MAG: GNAT family N-acetyltransferase, partial [Usitatibacteraceae bacterium]